VSTSLNQIVWLFFSGITFSCASPAHHGHVLHEERRTLPCGWQKGDRLEPDIIHPIRIALTQNGLERGEELLMAISDPDSPLYGQHWTQEEVYSFFGPSDESVIMVQQWLKESIPAADLAHPITQSRNKGWIEFSATVKQLENLLKTEFHNYHHDSGRTIASTEAYYVPASVREHVDFVWPGITLSHQIDASRNALRKRGTPVEQQNASVLLPVESSLKSTVPCSNNHSALEPACIRDLYGVPHRPAPFHPAYTHAIYSSGNDKYKQEDLDTFWSAYAPEVPKGTAPKQILIDGAADTRSTDTRPGELFLDISLTVPLVAPNTVTIVSPDDPVIQANATLTGGANSMLEAFDESYCTYSAYNVTGPLPGWDAQYPDSAPGGYKGQRQCGGVKPPSVLVSAWGASEDFYPISFQRRQCNEFMKLALQGTTILAATGNQGVAGYTSQCWGSNKDRWNVLTPANCPYVTAVGATMLKDGVDIRQPSENPELGYHMSGGGISAIYARPRWQEPFVSNYLQTVSVDKPGFTGLAPLVANNTLLADVISDFGADGVRSLSGRGLPDLSALGEPISSFIIIDGVVYQVGGTSVSVQYVGALITRINLERLSVGKPVVGFINPVLYKYADRIIRDITQGESNSGCNDTGYPTTVGWDAVTGLGVLKYEEALKLWLSI
ncbi:Pro-kumamolisin, activation domain-containing protein, partial [Bipolaris maydis]